MGRCPVNCIRTQTTSAPTRSALSPTSLATSSTSLPNTNTVLPIRHLNFKLNSSERYQLLNLVTLPCVMTPQSLILLEMPKHVVVKDQLMSFAEPKKQEPKKEKKAEAKPAAAAEPEKPKEKPADPWADCDKFTMDMDAWKRFYSNNDEDKSVEHFWTLITPEVKANYSLWKGTYQYSHELTMPFMAANLIGGMFQRIEKLRKHAFSSVVVGGTTNDMNITGLWFWRGNSLAFKRSPDWQIDYEVYDWEKLD